MGFAAVILYLQPVPSIAGFALLARTGDPVPGGDPGEVFIQFPEPPVISGTTIAFKGYGSKRGAGIYISRPGRPLEAVVDTATPAPAGAPGPFRSFQGVALNASLASGEDQLAFLAYYENNDRVSEYGWTAGQLHLITTSYGYLGPPSIASGTVWFGAHNGVFYAPVEGGPVATLVSTADRYPGSKDGFLLYGFANVSAATWPSPTTGSAGYVVFNGQEYVISRDPDFGVLGTELSASGERKTIDRVVTNTDPIPGGNGKLFSAGITSFHVDARGDVFFVGRTENSGLSGVGTYVWRSGSIARIADLKTLVPPARSDTFKRFSSIAGDNNAAESRRFFVAFTGSAGTGWADGDGLYVMDRRYLVDAALSPGDTLDGKTARTVQLSTNGLSTGVVAFLTQLSDGTYAIYVYEPDCASFCDLPVKEEQCAVTQISCEDCRVLFPRSNPTPANAASRTSSGNQSPSTASLAAAVSDNGPFLQTFRTVRDRLLAATPEGQRYIRLYDAHTAEIRDLITANPTLITKGIALLRSVEPAFQGILRGEGSGVQISTEQVQAVDDFLGALADKGSPALKAAIAEQRNKWGPLDAYVGKTMTEAQKQVLGYGVFLPRISNP